MTAVGNQSRRSGGHQQLREVAGRQQGRVCRSRRLKPIRQRAILRESFRAFHSAPVATSLLMAAILLVGIVAYTQLPVSALPEVDYPTIQVLTFYPGASPDVMATTVTAPAGAPVRPVAGPEPDDLDQFRRFVGHRAAVRAQPEHRHRRGRGSVLDQRLAELSAVQPSRAAGYSKTNPADAPVLTLAITSNSIPLSQVEDLVDTRLAPKLSQLSGSGPGEHQRRPEAGGAHSGQPDGAVVLRAQP
jgi:hypothetical protein